MRKEAPGSWRSLHNEELHNSYSSPNIIRVIKSRVIRWAEHVARMTAIINTYKIFVVELEIRNEKLSGYQLLNKDCATWS
jgi:hypothetical protein